MDGGGRPRGAWVRYALFQIPSLGLLAAGLWLLDGWIGLPGWVFWGLVACWIAKDVALFPLVWRSYLPSPAGHPLEGAVAVAAERLDPAGLVRVGPELWRAELAEGAAPVEAGQPVRVCRARGLTLVVSRVPE